jgi:hypothetical protein
MDIQEKLDSINSVLECLSTEIDRCFASIFSSIVNLYNFEYQSNKINNKREKLLSQVEKKQRDLLREIKNQTHVFKRQSLFFLNKLDQDEDLRILLRRFKLERMNYRHDLTFTKKCRYYHLFQQIETFNLENQSEHVYYLTLTTFLVIDKFKKVLSVTDRSFNALKTLKIGSGFAGNVISVRQVDSKIVFLCNNYEKMVLIYYILDFDLRVIKSKKFHVTFDLTYNYYEYDYNTTVVYIGPYTRKSMFIDLNLNVVDVLQDLRVNKKGRLLSFICGDELIVNNLDQNQVEVMNKLEPSALNACIDNKTSFLQMILFDFETRSLFLVKKPSSNDRPVLECFDMRCEFRFSQPMELFDSFLSYHVSANKIFLYDINNQLVIF